MHVVLLHSNGACRIIINKKVHTYTRTYIHTHTYAYFSHSPDVTFLPEGRDLSSPRNVKFHF